MKIKYILTKITLTILIMLFLNDTVCAIAHYDNWSSDKNIICDTTIDNWAEIQKTGVYNPDSLKVDGFIHCARWKQMLYVSNKFFKGKRMILMLIDPSRLISPIKFEGKLNSNLYPHVYGPINRSSVIDTKEMIPNPDGTYEIPKEFQPPLKKYHSEHFAICRINIKEWVDARLKGEYKPGDFDVLGYIPCLKPNNISLEKNYFKSNDLILVVDMRKVVSPIKKEGLSNSNLNPHIYGALNTDAVAAVLGTKLNTDGSVSLPKEILQE